MTPEQALAFVDQVAARALINRQDQQTLVRAIQILQQAIAPKTAEDAQSKSVGPEQAKVPKSDKSDKA